MFDVKRYILTLVCTLFAVFVLAQNNTSSPFSCYGLGDVNDNVPNTFRGMGSVGIGMRNNKVICPSQPASFTACDSLTFMFDLAADVMWTRYGDDVGTKNKANGNLDYITLQFPLYKRYVAFSAGVMPFSSVGYNIALVDSINSDYHYVKNYYGNGGISEVYGGLSFNLFDWVSLGANVYYMFGDVINSRSVSFSESEVKTVVQASELSVSSVRFREGLQFFHTFGKHTFVLGGIFENRRTIKSTLTVAESTQLDTVWVAKDVIQAPMMFGVGASYTFDKRLTIGFDFSRSYWTQVKVLEGFDALRDRNKYAFGAEYRHNPIGRNYAERMFWRVGCNLSDSYVEKVKKPDFMVSLGLGFPLRNAGTVFNVTVEYGHRGPAATLEEHYLRMTLNASIAENWFFKRRL
ncbi:MAG: hypothetical protein J5612_03580 [Paludibacteraceae bacterium]|nr:hypothetical protein [Paludibacteraceae bacterium]